MRSQEINSQEGNVIVKTIEMITQQNWKALVILLVAGIFVATGMPAFTLAQETDSTDLDVSFEVGPVSGLAPAEDGRVIRFVELTSYSLAEAGLPVRKERAHSQLLAEEKDDFRAEAASHNIDFVERYSYEVLLNGLAIDVAEEDLAALEALDSVAATYPVYRVYGGGTPVAAEAPEGTTRENVTVTELTGVPQAHAAGFTGEGIVVGIIDGGIDYNHRALGGPGFPNDKVIGGFDFADNDPDPFDDKYGAASRHGTHVSGIVAGDDEIMVGVAPDAKIRFYRVFGTQNHGGTEDVLLAAMEQAAEDGCDVVNMSWGSHTSGVIQKGIISRAADNLEKRDVVPVAAMGNFGGSGPFRPSSPATGKQVVAVGATENSHISELAFQLDNGSKMAYRLLTIGGPPPGSGTYPIVDFGTANCNPVPDDVSYAGKVVLVKHGSWTCNKPTMINMLADAGAEAVIWWQESYDPTRWMSTISSPYIPLKIPGVLIRQFDAEEIIAQGDGTMMTWGHYFEDPVDGAGLPIWFSSWGPTMELDLKPDVMAPGGYIFSTIPEVNGYYGLMNGTSMASPHVAGIVALIRQANPKMHAKDVRKFLMSTAYGVGFYSSSDLELAPVAWQGAGLVNALAAIRPTAKVDPAKLSLGDFNGETITKEVTIENKTGTDITYNVSHVPALTAMPPFTGYWNPSTEAADVIIRPTTLLVPAEGEADLTLTFEEPFTVDEGSILSGWIELTPVDGGDRVQVTYLGLKGDYHALPALNPTWSHFNPSIGNPSLRPESRPNCDVPPWMRPSCCNDPTPGSCYVSFHAGFSEPQTIDYTNDDKYDDMVFCLVSQGFPMLRKYRVEVLNNVGRTVAYCTDYHTGGRSLEEWEYWVRNSAGGTGMDLAQWHGILEDGSPAPAGTYYIHIEFDKFDGDGETYPDLETWTSPKITLIR